MAAQSGPRVVVAGGHVTDAPDRPLPRFPSDQVARVTEEVRTALDEWGVGRHTTLVTGGARGADIIVADECSDRGAQVVLCLAFEPDVFERRSVALPGTAWAARFRALLERAEVRVLRNPPPGNNVFTKANEWIVDTARAIDDAPHSVIVWDGKPGDGPGGTHDLLRLLGYSEPDQKLCVIDPTRRGYEARQDVDRPKRMLALDGGGIRGALSLEILSSLEARLRTHYCTESLVLDRR